MYNEQSVSRLVSVAAKQVQDLFERPIVVKSLHEQSGREMWLAGG